MCGFGAFKDSPEETEWMLGGGYWVLGEVVGEPSCPPTVQRTLRQLGRDYVETNQTLEAKWAPTGACVHFLCSHVG